MVQRAMYVKSPDGSRVLGVMVQGGSLDEWAVIGIETLGALGGAKKAAAIEKVFSDHAHEVIGVFRTEDAAMKKGEAYAKKWLRGQRAKKCDCGEISAPASSSLVA